MKIINVNQFGIRGTWPGIKHDMWIYVRDEKGIDIHFELQNVPDKILRDFAKKILKYNIA